METPALTRKQNSRAPAPGTPQPGRQRSVLGRRRPERRLGVCLIAAVACPQVLTRTRRLAYGRRAHQYTRSSDPTAAHDDHERPRREDMAYGETAVRELRDQLGESSGVRRRLAHRPAGAVAQPG